MKCSLSTQAYKWKSGDGWNVGRLVLNSGDLVVSHVDGLKPLEAVIEGSEMVLLAHSHTSELEFVRWGDLSAYGPPGESAMPQPESKETVK